MSAVDALAATLPRTTLVVGKGGVGKTTCAAALALLMGRDTPTLLLSTDPARALPSVLDQDVGADATAVGGTRLVAMQLDAAAARERFMRRWGDVIRLILDRGTYLDATDIAPLVDTALPGSDEIFSALTLAELLADPGSHYARIVVDTAPTGHTLRLLSLPRTFRALVRLLDAMQEKHRFMVRTLTRAYRADEADAFLRTMTALVAVLEDTLGDAARCAAVMVTNPQPLVLEETRRYLRSLADLRLRVAAVVWNGAGAAAPLETDARQYRVPRLGQWPVGIDGLSRWSAALRSARSGPRRTAASRGRQMPRSRVSSPPPAIDGMLRPLTIVAGKGGVGKTTVAAALALHSADSQPTLVVSTDPAPSLADALDQPVPDADTAVRGTEHLIARQMDASAAFARLRVEYQTRVDAIFDAVVARGADLTHDRAITRELLSLAPPGIDEVYALSLISDALFANRYGRVIVDPAPTGHLLRLLEMPPLALAWTHQLMRLMLKYKDIAGLGETAHELLAFARNLRALDALLRDPERAALVLVTLDEPVVGGETSRLATEARRLGIAVGGIVLNRARTSAPLPVAGAPVQFEAPDVDPPPSGVMAIRRWTSAWRHSIEPARPTHG